RNQKYHRTGPYIRQHVASDWRRDRGILYDGLHCQYCRLSDQRARSAVCFASVMARSRAIRRLCWGIPIHDLRTARGPGVLSSPLFFSGIVFSVALQHSEDISGAMAANLVGAMCGLLEYNSMNFGFAFHYWIAIGPYGAAFVASKALFARG